MDSRDVSFHILLLLATRSRQRGGRCLEQIPCVGQYDHSDTRHAGRVVAANQDGRRRGCRVLPIEGDSPIGQFRAERVAGTGDGQERTHLHPTRPLPTHATPDRKSLHPHGGPFRRRKDARDGRETLVVVRSGTRCSRVHPFVSLLPTKQARHYSYPWSSASHSGKTSLAHNHPRLRFRVPPSTVDQSRPDPGDHGQIQQICVP